MIYKNYAIQKKEEVLMNYLEKFIPSISVLLVPLECARGNASWDNT